VKSLKKDDLLESIFADVYLMVSIRSYDPKAESIMIRSSPRLQAKDQRWASHAILVKSDKNVLYPFQVIACHQNLGGGVGSNSFEYWSVGFPNLDMAAQAFCDVQNFNTPYLSDVKYDTNTYAFKYEPNRGLLDFETDLSKTSKSFVIKDSAPQNIALAQG
jgi:hypothetical protein